MKQPRKIETPEGPMTVSQASEYFKIPKGTLVRRLWSGWSVKNALLPAPRPGKAPPQHGYRYVRAKFITPWGRIGYSQLAHILGMSSAAMAQRIYSGRWTEEEFMNTPPLGRRGQHFVMPPEEFRRRVAAVREEERRAGNVVLVRARQRHSPTQKERASSARLEALSRASEFHGGRCVGPKTTCTQDGMERHACQE